MSSSNGDAPDLCTLGATLLKASKEDQQEAVLETLGALIQSDAREPPRPPRPQRLHRTVHGAAPCALWWTLRARQRLEQGHVAEALEDTHEALWLDPRSPEVLTLRVRALAASGSSAQALEVAKIAQKTPLNDLQRSEVQAVVRQEEERAARVCELGQRATQAWQQGRHDEAKELFTELLSLDPSSALWPVALARIHLAEKRPEESVKLCSQVLERQNGQAECHLVRAMAFHTMDREKEAWQDFQHAKRLGGLSAEARKDFEQLKLGLGLGYPEAKAAPEVPKQKREDSDEAVNPVASAAAMALLQRARQEEQEGQLRTAKLLCLEALKLWKNMPQAALCIGRIELANGEFENVLNLFAKTYAPVAKKGPGRVEALSLRAFAYERSKDWEMACDELEALEPNLIADAQNLSAEDGWAPQPKPRDLQGRLARARWHAGRRKGATSLVEQIMEEEPTQLEACEVACAVLMERGDAAIALAVMVRCLVEHRATPSKVSELVCGVMRHCSVEELCHVISPKLHANISERSVAEVVGFIGLIMKERGDLLEACRLYQKSVLMASDHGSLCLNLMHTYSLRRDDLRAVAWGKRFMQKQQLFAPVLAALDGKSVSDDAKIFGVKDFAAENEFHDALAIGLVTFKLLFLAQPRGFESKGEPSWLKRLKTMEIESHIVGPGVLSLMEDTWRRRSEMDASMLVGAQKHNQVLKRLCGVLEKCCQGHDLHLTPVRNENAYFRCIKDILARESSEAVPKAPTNFKPMFVVGDSHVLSMAWQFVDFDDQHFILIPLLVTGVKLWHLREESKFFTVFSFWDKLQIIPIETPVMFLLGEIDCREGVLTTVQKGKYTSFDDALRTIVNVYLDVLVQVRRKLTSNRIFVHPVPSVLPETRFLTMAMNNLLDSDWSQNSMNKARVKLLKIQSIFDSPVPEDADITTLSKLQLLPDLRLDGIHLSPSYVKSHLAPAMQQAWS